MIRFSAVAFGSISLLLLFACSAAEPAKKSSPIFEDDTKKKDTKSKGGMSGADPAGESESGRRGGPEGTPEEAPPDEGASSPAAPSTCTKDVDCGAATRICDAATSKCIKGCRDASGCPSGEVCSASSHCEKKSSSSGSTDQCLEDTECDLGFICTGAAGSKRCTSGCHTTFDCPLDEKCINGPLGQCVPDTGTSSSSSGGAVQCVSDGACNPGNNGAGKICEGGQCVSGCRKDLHCPGLTICVAGTCK
jgi:hypothetical protein